MADAPEKPAPVTGISFRALLIMVLFVVLLLSFIVILGSLALLREQVLGIIPPELIFEAERTLRLVLLGQALLLAVFAFLLLSGIYIAITQLVVKPLRSLTQAMDTYAESRERQELLDQEGAPRELRSLARSFTSFIDRVEVAHKRDMEIARVKSDFISTAAHQLRTPLTGIRWALEALEKEPLTENQKALVVNATEKSKDLVEIVKTLLDISSIESGKYHYRFTPTDINELLDEIARDFAEPASQRQVTLFFAKEHADLPMARTDRERIKWVLNNLIENAIRYTPAGGTVQLSAELNENRVLIKVKDTGIGIAEADRGNIFERFYRGSNAIAKENEGSGLGLYIARQIATDHKGELYFFPNEDSVGTTFILALPVA